jgi:hypothetical protein
MCDIFNEQAPCCKIQYMKIVLSLLMIAKKEFIFEGYFI